MFYSPIPGGDAHNKMVWIHGILRYCKVFSIVLHSIVWYCIHAPPKRGRYYEIHPLHPQDIPSPSSSGEIADEMNKIFPEVGEDCTIPTKRFRLQAVYGHSLIINRSLGDVGVLSANSIWSQFFTGTPLKS